MRLIGDIHCEFKHLEALLTRFKGEEVFLLGDVGVGFVNHPFCTSFRPHRVSWIRGNHDNPDLSRKHPDYLGEYGYLPKKKLFYLSGAMSIDKDWRTPGFDWWADEELSYEALDNAQETYLRHKPEIVLTHTCPDSIKNILLGKSAINLQSKTELALQAMWEKHKPSLWVFGHFHKSFNYYESGTQFVCLNILEHMFIK